MMTDDKSKVLIPFLNANDEFAIITDWLVKNGQHVLEGEVIVVIETTKSSIDILSPSSGVIELQVVEGDEVKVQDVIALIRASAEAVKVKKSAVTKKVIATDKAIALAKKLEINLEDVPIAGIVTTRDVENLAYKTNGTQLSLISDATKGRLDSSFVRHLKENKEEFSNLESAFKLDLYRKFGAIVGENVQLQKGAVLIAEQIVIGSDTVIEKNISIQAKTIEIGSFGRLRSGLDCFCRHVSIGAEAFFARNVIIGRGGSQEPTAEIIIGNRVFIGEGTLLNTGHPITIGDSSFIGQFSSIMTHNIGHSYLEGYDNAFAPVKIGSKVQVGVSCFIYPGVEIGSGSIISSNSSVNKSISENKMVAGVPAKVVGVAKSDLPEEEISKRFNLLVRRFIDLLEARNIKTELNRFDNGSFIKINYREREWRLLFTEEKDLNTLENLDTYCIVVSLNGGAFSPRNGSVYFDLSESEFLGDTNPVAEGVREFLRKAGIKLSPWPWRYKGGIL